MGMGRGGMRPAAAIYEQPFLDRNSNPAPSDGPHQLSDDHHRWIRRDDWGVGVDIILGGPDNRFVRTMDGEVIWATFDRPSVAPQFATANEYLRWRASQGY